MKTVNYFLYLKILCFLLSVSCSYSQNLLYKTIATEIDTLFYLPESATYVDQYTIAAEVYSIHTRFEPPADWDYYKIKEIHFLFSTMVINDTLKEILFFKDTLQTLIYSQPAGFILDSNDVYPNWYKVVVSDNFPSITGVIEIPVDVINLFSLCISAQLFSSGHTIGYFESSQAWGVTADYPVKLVIERDVTGIIKKNRPINDYRLYQNYPNPFNSTTTINYSIPEASFVKLLVYDALGREIKKIVNEVKKAGHYSIDFNTANLSSGYYFYQIKTNNFIDTKMMLLIK